MKNPRNRIVWLVVLAFALPSLRTVEVQAQEVTASETVTIKDHSKGTTWSGKAIKDVTVATLNVRTTDTFVEGSAKPAGVVGKWMTPINNTKQAQFKGLLSGANKYSPSFTGNFQAQPVIGPFNGTLPAWNVGTTPEIATSNDHEYLNFSLKKSGGIVNIAHTSQGMIVENFEVNFSVGTTNQRLTVQNFCRGTGVSFFEPYYTMASSYIPPSNNDYLTCPCSSANSCSGAVKLTVPVIVTGHTRDVRLRYPVSWLQDSSVRDPVTGVVHDHPEKRLINVLASQEAAIIISSIETHEKVHQADFAATASAASGFLSFSLVSVNFNIEAM